MSKHWRPDLLTARPIHSRRWTRIDGYSVPPKPRLLPPGAGVGLVLVALACFALGFTYYQLWGPRDAFAQDSQIDWNTVQPATFEQAAR